MVTTDDEEFTLAHKKLKGRQIVTDYGPNQGQLCLGEIGKNKIALLKASPRETVRVDVLCAKTIQNLEPKAIVSVGVCSGTKENEHHLGDVLISSQVDFYNPVGAKSPKLAVHDCNLALTTLVDQASAGWYGPEPGVVDPERHVGQIISAAQDMSNTAYKDEVGLLYPDAIGLDKQSGGKSKGFQLYQYTFFYQYINLKCTFNDSEKSVESCNNSNNSNLPFCYVLHYFLFI